MDGGTEVTFELEIDLPDSAFDRFTERLVYDRLERTTLRHTLENRKPPVNWSANIFLL